MNIKSQLFLCLSIFLSASYQAVAAPADEELLPISILLSHLDDAIAHKEQYQTKRSLLADSLRQTASHQQGTECIGTLRQLYDVVTHYKTEEAFDVLSWERRLPEYASDPQLQISTNIDEARVYGQMGLYDKAFDMLHQIRPNECDDATRLRYYNAMHTILDWRADYALRTAPALAESFLQQAAVYHDSLLMLEPGAENRTIISTNRAYDSGQYQACIDTLLQLMDRCNPEQRTFAYSRLAQAYDKLGNKTLSKRYLILTAIADIRAGITEYMALPELAHQLQTEGDSERAYRYLTCALEDANICKSNLRTLEASTIFPIIEETNRQQQERARFINYLSIFGLIFIVLLLMGGIFALMHFNKKLQSMRRLLAKANDDLKVSNLKMKAANRELEASNRTKEDYLMKFLISSRGYLANIETMQRQLLKLMQARQFDEIIKKLKASDYMDEEQQRFYADFDEAFLTLYPNFVERFNALLKPDCAILPRKGELLTTELRIYALIRMGETDSTKLAKFLNYSLTTIYNYRSRVRNNALGDKDTFEDEVMKL